MSLLPSELHEEFFLKLLPRITTLLPYRDAFQRPRRATTLLADCANYPRAMHSPYRPHKRLHFG
jgi:hypothetical protein